MLQALVISGDQGLHADAEAVLAPHHIRTTCASSDRAALEIFAHNHVDVVVVQADPVSSGRAELLRILAEMRAPHPLPIVMIVEAPAQAEVKSAIATTMAIFLLQPFRPGDLVSAIQLAASPQPLSASAGDADMVRRLLDIGEDRALAFPGIEMGDFGWDIMLKLGLGALTGRSQRAEYLYPENPARRAAAAVRLAELQERRLIARTAVEGGESLFELTDGGLAALRLFLGVRKTREAILPL